jgi:hypothetical protein
LCRCWAPSSWRPSPSAPHTSRLACSLAARAFPPRATR